ncbi:general transcription factor IIF subunit 1-like [Triticum dicoccoides]|uniref:general transcription factor IIF subunit 1-like n=1 Tax=Triticum dicoccoides TaxID=85692 RepID=UPI000E792411|nr:general transcription factor IIF subunit 1-like [Triticum dicoccoides]
MAGEDQPLTEYEKQRLARIRENEARLQALGIRRLAASPLLNQPSSAAAAAAAGGGAKRKQKKRSDDADEEYLPSDGGGGEEEEEEEGSSASDQDSEEEFKASSRSNQKGKAKKKMNLGSSSKSTVREEGAPFADFMDDDAALQQAIALSLAEPSKSSVTTTTEPSKSSVTTTTVAETSSRGAKGRKSTPCKNDNTTPVKDSAKNRKTKKQVRSRIQLSEDDVVAIFFSFDEAGKGYIAPWDLEKMANINDFIWTDFELSKMIHCFDSDKDGKISLEEFRTIVSRCNMLQEPEE